MLLVKRGSTGPADTRPRPMTFRLETSADGSTRVATDAATEARRSALTDALRERMHRAYHSARGLAVCGSLACGHPWYPR